MAPSEDSAPAYYAIALVMSPQASRPGCPAVHVVGASPISGSARRRQASTSRVAVRERPADVRSGVDDREEPGHDNF